MKEFDELKEAMQTEREYYQHRLRVIRRYLIAAMVCMGVSIIVQLIKALS